MQIKLPDTLKKWVYYDEKSFSYKLKHNAPEDIMEKFKKYKNQSLDRYKIK